MNCPRRHVSWQRKRLYWKRGAWTESSRVGEPRRTALLHGRSLRDYDNGVSFRVVSGQSSCLDHSLDSGSFLVARASLSQDGFQSKGLWEVGRLLPLLAPPEFSRLAFEAAPCSLSGPPDVRQLRHVGLAKACGFGQQFPKGLTTNAVHVSPQSFTTAWGRHVGSSAYGNIESFSMFRLRFFF